MLAFGGFGYLDVWFRTYIDNEILLALAFFGFIFNYIFCLFNRRGLAVQDMLSNTITLKMPKVAQEGLWRGFKNRKSNR